jgi:hypothetical protein
VRTSFSNFDTGGRPPLWLRVSSGPGLSCGLSKARDIGERTTLTANAKQHTPNRCVSKMDKLQERHARRRRRFWFTILEYNSRENRLSSRIWNSWTVPNVATWAMSLPCSPLSLCVPPFSLTLFVFSALPTFLFCVFRQSRARC